MWSQLKTEGVELIPKARVARDFVTRLMGLMGRRSLAADQAIVFPNCNSIHTFFMRFPIDVVFVDRHGVVIDAVESVKPWRLLLPRRGVKHTIELAPLRSRELGIAKGMRLECEGGWA